MKLIAYETVPPEGWMLKAGEPGRVWMDSTAERSAYRCLPLLMASQAGWLLSSPASVRVRWNGKPELAGVEIWRCVDSPLSPDYLWPISHFGQGIVTWTLPWLFRTPPGYNLLVRGPANSIKDGIAPLEGLVETDWAVATFTMNWKITRPDKWITFEEGEPICMIVPQRRGELEEFTPEIAQIEDNPELERANAAWCNSRDRFHAEWNMPTPDKPNWEKHYMRGTSPAGVASSEHQTRLHLQEFK